MDEFSAYAALAVGVALTLKAYGVDILAYLERLDQKFLKMIKPYVRKARHSKRASKGRHHIRRGEKFYCYDKKTGMKVIWA